MNSNPRIAIAGVTGAVGQEFLQLLEQRHFPFASLKMLASARSAGTTIEFKNKQYVVEELTEDSFTDVDLALFSAGGTISAKFAPIAASKGCVVVDNSSAFRMDPNVPLIVPEVNPEAMSGHPGIIANPNCSTIIMNVPVWPLHQVNPVRRISVCTYQAASGAGAAAMRDLEDQARQWSAGQAINSPVFGKQYIWNLFSHNSDIDQTNGYNTEEIKMIKETRKIFGNDSILVTATCVRVPVLRAHCEAINLTFERPISEDEIREILSSAPGVSVMDDRKANRFPEPLDASGQDDVFVGRIRRDLSQPDGCGIELFVAGDQIRKGAALNAVQIAELLIGKPVTV